MAGLVPATHAVEHGPTVIIGSIARLTVIASPLAKQSSAPNRTAATIAPPMRHHV